MNPEQRKTMIQERLQQAFSPRQLEVIDDSAKHAGHVGSQGGAGHYTVLIAADCFAHLPRVHAHRKIYQVLSDLIPEQIHALNIKIIP